VIYKRTILGKAFEIARVRPGSAAKPEILGTYTIAENERWRIPLASSPATGQILVHSGGSTPALFLMSADYRSERQLTTGLLEVAGFARTGADVIGVMRNRGGDDGWQLVAIDTRTGRERLLATLDLPAATDGIDGFSLHPDGKRFVTSIRIWPADIWMLEGFARPLPN
jgi:hypothetical protein